MSGCPRITFEFCRTGFQPVYADEDGLETRPTRGQPLRSDRWMDVACLVPRGGRR